MEPWTVGELDGVAKGISLCSDAGEAGKDRGLPRLVSIKEVDVELRHGWFEVDVEVSPD